MSLSYIDRRDFLKTLSLGGAGLAMSYRGAKAAERMRRKPNVILVMTDDQGWGDIHSHGNDILDTPVIDRLAASGARFDRFFVNPVCAPTRAGLLTGRYPLRTGVSGVTRGLETMRSDEVTLAEMLKTGGYATGCFGKWHNGAHYPYHPLGRGFDEFLGFCAGHWNNYFDTHLDHNGRQVETRGYINDVLTDAALRFIENNRERPFFLYLPYNTPHSPYQVPQSYFDKYTGRGLDNELAAVYGMCESLDDCTGRLLDRLDKLGLADDSIVIFLTDNGPNGRRYNGLMRGVKSSVHEGGCRVPCFIRWPGRIAPGTVVEPIAAHIDILPTVAELTGVEMPARTLPLDGVSLAPLLTGELTAAWPERMIFTSFFNNGAVRTQSHRLVLKDGREAELYDMLADPGETRDIAGKLPEVAGKLEKAYEQWYADVTSLGIGRRPRIPVGWEEMKLVELPAPECYMEGGVRYNGRAGWANDWVTGWTGTKDLVYWEIDVVRGGRYEITLLYTCPEEDLGAGMQVEAAGEKLERTVDNAHDPSPVHSPDRVPRKEVYEKVWARLAMGVMRLTEGRTRLCVRALSVPGRAVIDLKGVRMRRID